VDSGLVESLDPQSQDQAFVPAPAGMVVSI